VILDVDLGNSRVKWRSSDRPGAIESFRLGEELPPQWSGADRLRLASVLSAGKTAGFIESVLKRASVDIQVARVQQDCAGLHLAYVDVTSFGADRWLALLAARARFPGRDCVVLSGGTALTADLLDAQGKHLGGYIAPGWHTAARSLWQNTDRLDAARRDLVPQLQSGATTLQCIAAGLTLMYRGFIAELRQRSAGCLRDPQWILTGGEAQMLSAFMEGLGESDGVPAAQIMPTLVLDGLALALP
jgi:type III pantothenate kinase